MSEYNIASFDIECDSSHGDFPMAKKDFKKLAQDIYHIYHDIYHGIPHSSKEEFIKNQHEFIYDLILISFNLKQKEDNPLLKKSEINKIFTYKTPTKDKIKNVVIQIMEKNILENIQDSNIKAKDRDKTIHQINRILKPLGKVLGDPVIQIGTVFHRYGSSEPPRRHIIVIGPDESMEKDEICDDLENIEVVRCQTEKELLLEWTKVIQEEDPDFITGYNIFGFDFKYMIDRVDECIQCHPKCNKWGHHISCEKRKFYNLGKMNSEKADSNQHYFKKCNERFQELTSSGLGENHLTYITMDGRILFDIQKEVQKGHNLESYKLDNVAANFMRGKIKQIDEMYLKTYTGHLKRNDYISFRTHSNIGEELYEEGRKYQIQEIQEDGLILKETLELQLDEYIKVEWCLNKDDIEPQDIFDKHKQIEGGAKARAEVAKYCIQDCELCIHLLLLLDIVPNNLAMANVSYVPGSYIFLRGQGVKVTSVVARKCGELETRIPDLKKLPKLRDYVKMKKDKKTDKEIKDEIIKDITNNGDDKWRTPKDYEIKEWLDIINRDPENYKIEGFEGAIVLKPKPDIYLDDPVAVLDYASLYPSSIIEKNLSHETNIEDEGLIEYIGKENLHEIKYENFVYQGKGKGDTVEKVVNENEPIKTCYFLKSEFMEEKGIHPKGIIPQVLDHLLDARKATKFRMKNEKDEFKKKVLDGLQLAYKITANSVYGQLGATTSTIFKMNIAACTTSIGRERIDDAEYGAKKWASELGYKEPEIVYGDTDSIFVKFNCEKDGKKLEGKEALAYSIQCGIEVGDYITKGKLIKNGEEIYHKPILSKPQDLEYEKTFWPFILISKKRYTGDKYELSTEECKRTAMGIVLKRRDNAPIVKYVFGHVIEKIMIEKDFEATIQWLKETLCKIRNGEFSDTYFVITKSLRGYYKNPQQIAHKVLADRMSERDPGNKPKANDRIPYAYIQLSDDILYDKENPYKSGIRKGEPRLRNILQGDRIEHIDYIRKNGLKLDYEFYITNQIMNPVKQVLDLRLNSSETEKIFQ